MIKFEQVSSKKYINEYYINISWSSFDFMIKFVLVSPGKCYYKYYTNIS